MTDQRTPTRPVLGVYVMPHTIEAVLLHTDEGRPEVLHRLARPRALSLGVGKGTSTSDYSTVLPGLKTSEEADFTLEVGRSATDMALDPELAKLAGAEPGETVEPEGAKTFTAALQEILDECAALGYDDPEIAFCAGTPDMAYVEIEATGAATPSGMAGWMEQVRTWTSGMSAERRRLLSRLQVVYESPFAEERVAFIPMTPGPAAEDRHLAVVPTSRESVTPTLNTLNSQRDRARTSATLLDAEPSLYRDAVARYLAPKDGQTTAVVRVGAEDTLLLFIAGTELRHVDRLRSLTSYDPAETIGSRVLLYQDEKQIDAVDAVLLVGGPPDRRLEASFRTFYPEAVVGRLDAFLLGDVVTLSEQVGGALAPDSGPALAVALRALAYRTEEGGVNLFGEHIRHVPQEISLFAWHTVAMLLVLGLLSLFFTWRFLQGQQEIALRRAQMPLQTTEMLALSPGDLRTQVDSINTVHQQYTRALIVLDSLLHGSDEWSQAMARTAAQTRDVEGIWFEDWSLDPSTVQIQGSALSRNRLAQFARSLDGTIERVEFAEIEGQRVYPFTVRIPRIIEMPKVASALRARPYNENEINVVVPSADSSSDEDAPVRRTSSPD